MTPKEPRKGRSQGDPTVLREPVTQFIESDLPIIAVAISVVTTINQLTAALRVPNHDSFRKGPLQSRQILSAAVNDFSR
jgi:hypothetical protein